MLVQRCQVKCSCCYARVEVNSKMLSGNICNIYNIIHICTYIYIYPQTAIFCVPHLIVAIVVQRCRVRRDKSLYHKSFTFFHHLKIVLVLVLSIGTFGFSGYADAVLSVRIYFAKTIIQCCRISLY